MQTRNFIFETIKAHLRARGITYKDLSKELGISEQTIKRIFATCDCSLERLEGICALLHIELRDLIKTSPRPKKLIERLTYDQEIEFAQNKNLLMVAICTMGLWSYQDMLDHLTLSVKECVLLLNRLDEIGFIELRAHQRYRLLVAREFSWIVDGPIMRMVKGMAGDYFNHLFDGEGELLKIINVRISPQSRKKLKSKLELIAQEYADQVSADAHLPLHDRPPLSICIAARTWVPQALEDLMKADKVENKADAKLS